VHVTVVDATGKIVELAGVQLTVTGGAPDVAIGSPYATVIGWPRGEVSVTGCGHVIAGWAGSVGGGAGLVGDPHAVATSMPTSKHQPLRDGTA
jgi:hypothetical protein